MKKIIGLLAVCLIGLAGAAVAQQAEESPKKGKETTTEKTPRTTGGERKSKMMGEEKTTPAAGTKEHGVRGEHAAKTETNATSSPAMNTETSPAPERERGEKRNREHANTTAETNANASPSETQPPAHGRKGRGRASENAAATPAATASAAVNANTANTERNRSGTTGGKMTASQGTVGRGGKKVEAQQVQQIKQQHASFHAQPRPDRAPAVTFNANFHIQNSDHWQGPQYEVFRSYHPEWHDRGWYHSHYQRVELIGGGYYYWNNGYWYPAWGYDPSAQYYAYDGPIYVGERAEPPDQVIADVQAELQDMGYYTGEVDGLLGPLTQQALADYQADHDLPQTSAIDEPTLQALQLS
jgi:hypothetical protein